ncbi:uncharacterized protein LOC105703394 [Orussus abietinus]|uniref:uncharacterized protein LOC105703394 n=1 Tax=Orussus abietinus TaxID=222816 RepID=UPI0006250681|nr:uncharacterized protein LOC105703394 [Orussus abietinus]
MAMPCIVSSTRLLFLKSHFMCTGVRFYIGSNVFKNIQGTTCIPRLTYSCKQHEYISTFNNSVMRLTRSSEYAEKGIADTSILKLPVKLSSVNYIYYKCYSATGASSSTNDIKQEKVVGKSAPVMSRKEAYRLAIKDYGKAVVVFHVSLSLLSLGICYFLVSRGFDAATYIKSLKLETSEKLEVALASSSTFVVAYAIHKMLAPIRLSLTVAVSPFLVKYLRKSRALKIRKKQEMEK